jgi:hypothetical protein
MIRSDNGTEFNGLAAASKQMGFEWRRNSKNNPQSSGMVKFRAVRSPVVGDLQSPTTGPIRSLAAKEGIPRTLVNSWTRGRCLKFK